MRLVVNYHTVYTYSEPIRRVIQLLRLTPSSYVGQHVLDWRVDVDCDARLKESRDGFGNITHMLYVDHPVEQLTISVMGQLLTEDRAGVVQGIAIDLPPLVFMRSTPLTQCDDSPETLAHALVKQHGTPLDRLHRLMGHIHTRMDFDTEVTNTETTAAESFSAGHGVCQDFAHIFVAVARAMGIPARYISGHVFRRDGAELQVAAHAWAEAWAEGLGWVAFDAANKICADDAYIRVACGLDYLDAAPIVGARSGGGFEQLKVEVQVSHARLQSQVQVQG